MKRSIKQIREYINDPSIDIKDRLFLLFSVSVILAIFVAIPCGIIMREPVSATVSTFAGVVFFTVYVYYSFKVKRIERARSVISVILIFIFLPVMFFSNGGGSGGAPVWLLLGCFYVVMTLDGRRQMVMSICNVLVLIACWIIGYFFPALVTEYSRGGNYFDSLTALIIVSNVIVIMVGFQTNLFIKQSELAEQKSKELYELNRSQNRFFSSMSHEIRTPINTVLGLNEIILRQEDASEEIKNDARNIRGAGRLLLSLINDILDVSKIEAGKMDIVPVDYNISSLLSEIVNMIWLKAEEKGLRFDVDIDPAVPRVLFGDEIRIKQILINLLNNAVKYTKEGSIGLHMECEFSASGDVLLKINVSDTGVGIKSEALPHLFDTFQRLDEEKNRYIEGTGLGLSIVKQLVDLMNGEITVNSVYGRGSTFSVILKQGISSEEPIGDINVFSSGKQGVAERFEHTFHAPDARILIVDDNEMNLQVEEKLLRGTEMTVDLASSGSEALIKTLQYRYDVIFMDHLMPEMDGIECFSRIRKQEGGLNKNIPVIALTANAGSENIELYSSTGFDGYLVKPVSGRQLEDMLITHLPAEKVITSSENEMTHSALSTAGRYSKMKPVVIATSSMCDLPPEILKELSINVIPYTVTTSEGVFLDNIDIDSEELIKYMGEELKFVTSEPPTVEEFTAFFSNELKNAHHLIYISLTTRSSREYGRAMDASKSFENVTVINSECLSSGTGLLTLVASRLVQLNLNPEKVVSELEIIKKNLRCSFIVRDTDVMARRERISPFLNGIFKGLWLKPMLRTKNDNLGVGGLLFGDDRRCYEEFIKKAVPKRSDPDTSLAFITYAGMDEEELQWVEERLKERVSFDNIIFQKASAGITSNCGAGTFGIIYMEKGNFRNYNLGAFFSKKDEDDTDDLTVEALSALTVGQSEETSENTPAEETKEPEWYEKLPGIDSRIAIKNSGSLDSFLSVLKIYLDTYEAKSGEIRDFYEAGDWENYTIKVHALKSSSRLIGAIRLGDDAEALEMAGKKADIEFIRANHSGLMDSYHAIYDSLHQELGAPDERAEVPPDMLSDAYAGLTEFTEAMDYELARMVVDSMKEYRLPPEDEERFKKIEISLSKMDWDSIKDMIKNAR